MDRYQVLCYNISMPQRFYLIFLDKLLYEIMIGYELDQKPVLHRNKILLRYTYQVLPMILLYYIMNQNYVDQFLMFDHSKIKLPHVWI